MTRRRKIVLAAFATVGITLASLGVSQTQPSGCGACGKASVSPPNLDGGGDHHFPDGSDEIEEREH